MSEPTPGHHHCFVVFGDLKGFSTLDYYAVSEQYRPLVEKFTKSVSDLLERAWVVNTWGDAIFVVFPNGRAAETVELIRRYRDFYRVHRAEEGALKLTPRIGASHGLVHIDEESAIGGRFNAYGDAVVAAARIEPVTPPGRVFVTDAFRQRLEDSSDVGAKLAPLGKRKLAKKYPPALLYELYFEGDVPLLPEGLTMDCDVTGFPPRPSLDNTPDGDTLDSFEHIPISDENISDALLRPQTPVDNEFRFRLGNLCRSQGRYGDAVLLLTATEELDSSGPAKGEFRHVGLPEVTKALSNAHTRVGDYDRADRYLQQLWNAGHQDSDTLCMLAAQWKRAALYERGERLPKARVNHGLLKRARLLYLEAWGMDFLNVYAPINVAYLLCMSADPNDRDLGRGVARHIELLWGPVAGRNWWTAISVAEAVMLEGREKDAVTRLKAALERKHTVFDVVATLKQVELYAHFGEETNAIRAFVEELDFAKQRAKR